jgi:Ca-activated chloride channel family protein
MPSSRGLLTATAALAAAIGSAVSAQQGSVSRPAGAGSAAAPVAVFRSSANLVTVSAVVRDKRGRIMPSLGRADFQIVDGSEHRAITDVYADSNAPASVALLVDGSGSMRLGDAAAHARRISSDVLASLDPGRDAAALMSFDTRLITLCDFTRDFAEVRSRLGAIETFGATSVYDAVAGSAAIVADRARTRRAVIVLTDGVDNASAYTPEQVAWAASRIDVPVYIFALADPTARRDDNDDDKRRPQPLAQLAEATGGDYFEVQSIVSTAAAVKRVTEELRHQYVIAFEAGTARGLRRVEIRTRRPELRVQARDWYQGLPLEE